MTLTCETALIIAPGCHYWPEHSGNRAAFVRHDQLLKAVKATAKLVGWAVSEDNHSGGWEWQQDPVCGMGWFFYATPEWEGAKGGVAFERAYDIEGKELPDLETEWLQLELTGNAEMDALRIVLKVINHATRGY